MPATRPSGSQIRDNSIILTAGAGQDVSGILPVANGGTGISGPAQNQVLLGNGATNPLQGVAPGTANNQLTSDGTIWISKTPGVVLPMLLLAVGAPAGPGASGKWAFASNGAIRTAAAQAGALYTTQWTPSLWTTTGRTVQLRLMANIMTNAVASGGVHTFALTPITPAGGAVGTIGHTFGTNFTTCAVTPSAGTQSYYADSGWVTAPAAGAEYAITINFGTATAANSYEKLVAQLYARVV